MRSTKKIQEIQDIVNSIVNVILSEGDVRGMQAAPMPTELGVPNTGSGANPQKPVAIADTGKSTKGDHDGSSTGKGRKIGGASKLSKNNPTERVDVSPDPLGVYSAKSAKHESIKDDKQKEGEESLERDKEKAGFPANLEEL